MRTMKPLFGRFVLVALALVPIASCGGDKSSIAASSELSAAIDRTSAVRSVRIVASATGPNTSSDVVTIDYQAPDRTHTVQVGADAAESFTIGSTVYQSDATRPGYFRPTVIPADSGIPRNIFSPLQSLKNASAIKKGDTYTVTARGGEGSFVVKVRDGLVAQVVTESAGMRSVQDFSLFDAAPPVIEPPAEYLLPALPPAEECKPGEARAVVCIDKSPPTPDEPLHLPAVSPGFAPSDLQFRPVTGDGTDCLPKSRNPAPSSAGRLSDKSGHCYELGPSELTVSRAEATAVRDHFSDAIIVEFKLNAEDAATFNQVAHRHLSQRVAIVMFGRVVSAPTFQTDEYQGSGQISGLDPTTAAEVVASLSG